MSQYSDEGYIFYGLVLDQNEFCHLLKSPQPYIGLSGVDDPEFSVQMGSIYEFNVNEPVVHKIKKMREHPYNIIVRVVPDTHLKVFVGVCRTWDIPVSSIAYCDEVFGLLELSKVLGFPDHKSGHIYEYENGIAVDGRVDMYPDWILY